MLDRSISVNMLHDKAGVFKFDLRARFNILKLMYHKVSFTEDLDVLTNDWGSTSSYIHTQSNDAPTLRVLFPKTLNLEIVFITLGTSYGTACQLLLG